MAGDKAVEVRLGNHPEIDEYSQILDRAKNGDRTVLPKIREFLDLAPDIVDELGDFDRLARAAMLNLMDGGDLLVREAEERKLDALAEQIAGPHPAPLEKLLARQITLCWQQLRYVEIRYAQVRDYTLSQGDYYQRWLDRTQNRYLQAIKTLAQVRKLGLPALQLNIAAEGGKQVNVA